MINILPLLAMVASVHGPHRDMIQTEEAFAADTAARGAAFSFRAFVAPDGIALLPNPKSGVLEIVSARQRIETRPLPAAPAPVNIRWWPAIAGLAGSGELGFTSGPVIFPKPGRHGFVFTVWERQPDGSWKYYFDGGPDTDGPSNFPSTDKVRLMPAATARARTPGAALVAVAAAERRLHNAARKNLSASYRPFLTSFTQLMGSGGQPAFGAADAAQELNRRGQVIAFERLGAKSARSADFVFTYGRALIDGIKQGGYTRIWQNSRSGWKIVVDQVQVPGPPPARPAS